MNTLKVVLTRFCVLAIIGVAVVGLIFFFPFLRREVRPWCSRPQA